MAKTLLTAAHIVFIKENRLKMSASDMGRKFGIDKNIVGRYMRKHKLTAPAEIQKGFRSAAMQGKTTSDKKTDDFLNKNYLQMPVKTMAATLDRSGMFVSTRLRQLGLIIPPEIIEHRRQIGRIKAGNTPTNKGRKQTEYMTAEAIAASVGTRFKKGQLPHNAVGFKDGDITIRHDHPDRGAGHAYKYIRLSLGIWKPLHTHLWEQKNGKVPPGHCLWFRDGNSLNCELDNLELITRKDNRIRNSGSTMLTDGYVARSIVGKSADKELVAMVKENTGLVELKRTQLLIKRKIRQHAK